MSSGTVVCKEQCTKCHCIVKERVIDTAKKNDDCTAVYQKLGKCLSQCLMEKCKAAKKKNECNMDDCC